MHVQQNGPFTPFAIKIREYLDGELVSGGGGEGGGEGNHSAVSFVICLSSPLC